MKIENAKRFLEQSINTLEISDDVVKVLLPDGQPHDFETDFWDYKRELPVMTSKEDKKQFDFKLHEIIKDIVSFHNAYGGYLVFGVKDKGDNPIIGCSDSIDCDDIGRRIRAFTGADIQCYYKKFSILVLGDAKDIGLLMVPRRKSHASPVMFKKAGPEFNGQRPYQKDTVYIRKNSECIPATSSAEDWKFLLSDRVILNDNSALPNIHDNLPPRDQDLISFVGREVELERLRIWMLDDKSPIRLLTGIGGLGKTSIAYRFAEEVCKLGIKNIDSVIWVTAKRETFSAISGRMVPTTRNDFSNTEELLRRLVVEVCGESSIEEDFDRDELLELLVDGLCYMPSLIIVDDIDSLAPDDQRDCVSLLQQVALRTVGRDHPSSRFLLTSRLDQGMPLTSVIKISGLAKADFELHLQNLFKQFGISIPNRQIQNQIFEASSGSPLFASSIVRMLSLGESLGNLFTNWSGSDGEDVREFAFKRELERLSGNAAAVLLATLRLGECSFDEIADVVEVPKKSLQEALSELHAYHLLSKSENKLNVIIFTASKELIAVTGIVRKHLGARADNIDRACARIRKSQGDQSRNIGIGIKKIVSLWGEGQVNEALLVAKGLAETHSKNGDVLCALGKAYMMISPPNYSEAEKMLSKAVSFGCQRKELFSLLVEAKKQVADWRGLRDYVCNKSIKSSNSDEALSAHIMANSNLYKLALDSGRHKDAADYLFEIIKRISKKIEGSYLSEEYFSQLCQTQNKYAYDYLCVMESLHNRAGDKLEVVNAVLDIYSLSVSGPNFILKACSALKEWFASVENRPLVDMEALKILGEKISVLKQFESNFANKLGDEHQIVKIVSATIRDLEFRGGELSRSQ